ncbi:hypothetical protein GWO43_21195 [candidate division KSB1 bacterium]|nr:hypothetical protein [candidate division KSB1 bacterium]NIS26581.1 hypothetical protein [candidate division KSB1 bacterium]NIT73343.1 hypothetical protein [candidate division KSB1 bacterium]NIV93862.1 hypothetical protein [candidate division KSB1 bacterium]NIX73023.1 hypothetical protein [candidate division KSB1 bacterium]
MPEDELHKLLEELLTDTEILEEIERIGYLRLTEKAFEFWGDPREDVYQDYVRSNGGELPK